MNENNLANVVDSFFGTHDVDDLFFNEGFDPNESRWDSSETKDLKEEFQSLDIVVCKEDHYGGEGQGDEYWTVYSFSRGTEKVYIQFNGWYASYNGAEFTERFFVQPRQKMVTYYERSDE